MPGYGVGGCPAGTGGRGCVPPGLAAKALTADRIANADAFRTSRFAAMSLSPLALTGSSRRRRPSAMSVSRLVWCRTRSRSWPLPAAVSYLYPDTPDYYYHYGDGYLYQVDRGKPDRGAAPAARGRLHARHYLPQPYMSSYAPITGASTASTRRATTMATAVTTYGYGYGSRTSAIATPMA